MSRSSRRAGRRRALGQHYLADGAVVDLMVRTACIEGPERVLEIGTGKGVVTRELCKTSTRVEAFELDHENVLATRSLGLDGLVLHEEDAFSAPREFDVLVSSLPYSESSNFVDWLAKLRYRRAIVLLQRDFAWKLIAQPGDESYRAVSVISQISSEVRVIRDVARTSFDPPPRVLGPRHSHPQAIALWRTNPPDQDALLSKKEEAGDRPEELASRATAREPL